MIGVVLGTGWNHCQVGGDMTIVPRTHLYEVEGLHDAAWYITKDVRTAAEAGVSTFVLTNAVGGLNPDLEVGEIIAISDHINLTGHHPKTGFLPLPHIYTVPPMFRRGVYAEVIGPAFETPAEARYLRTMGADIVGMSLAVEAVQLAAMDCRVVGLSLITNVSGSSKTHEDVLGVASLAPLDQALKDVFGWLEEQDGA